MGNLKVDFINGAYSKLRISGLTVNPSPEDLVLALSRLENIASELYGRNIDVNYNFEDTPDANSLHNVDRMFWDSFHSILAVSLCSDFNKQPPATLVLDSSKAYSFLSAKTALVKAVNYPSRMPRGSGNTIRFDRWNRFYAESEDAPLSSKTINMIVGDVDDFTEHFDSYLKDTETVSSYTITADTGLTISNDSLTSPDVSYRVTATGTSDGGNDLLQVKIVATTSLGRKETRVINFKLTDVD